MEELKNALGQCFWVGINGTEADEESTRAIFKEFQPAGIILFQRNVESIEQVQRLNRDLQKQSSIPLLIAVDQEGGVVERLHKIIGSIPPAMAFTASGSKLTTRRLHQAHARILRLLGFNVNFTPVLDLALASSNNGLGTRCFSSDPRTVKDYAEMVIAAHQKSGVMPCGKHFPGLGDTDRDSHLDLPSVSRPWRKILKQDLAPYKALLQKLPFIMINHALYPD
ncbi:MAG TPA: glycoside hydrolase family 3 N-terminal domain-containing protein, partial [Acidobacteriota bacterium]